MSTNTQEVTNRQILTIYENSEGLYSFTAGQGTNVNEIVFATAMLMKCFVRDKLIDSTDDLEKLLHKYLTDEQYAEITDKEE